jgi:Phasin protein
MRPEFFSQYTDAGRRSFANLASLGELQTRTLYRMSEIQLKFAALGIEGGAEQARLLLSGNSNYQELFEAEAALATELGQRFTRLGQHAAQIIAESREEYMNWLSRSFNGVQSAPAKTPAAKRTETKTPAKRSSARKAA